jgi:hypothetical protein
MSGGPAFPHEYKYGDGTAQRADGMTLRDYFAAKAMQSVISAALPKGSLEFSDAAKAGYNFADAMLAAREVTS